MSPRPISLTISPTWAKVTSCHAPSTLWRDGDVVGVLQRRLTDQVGDRLRPRRAAVAVPASMLLLLRDDWSGESMCVARRRDGRIRQAEEVTACGRLGRLRPAGSR